MVNTHREFKFPELKRVLNEDQIKFDIVTSGVERAWRQVKRKTRKMKENKARQTGCVTDRVPKRVSNVTNEKEGGASLKRKEWHNYANHFPL